jgi:type II secretory pathway component PulK
MSKNAFTTSKRGDRLKKAFFLLVVLSSVSFLTAVVTQMISSVSRSGVILSDVKNSILADSLCDSALDIVKRILQDDLSRGRYDFYSENFASEEELWSKTYILPVDVLYGKIRVIITDENAKLNVNSLVDSQGKTEAVARQSYLKVFQKFLKIMSLDERFAGYIQDWIDFDSEGIFEIHQQSRNWFIPYPEELLFVSNLVKIDISPLVSDYFEGRPDATGYPYTTFWPYAGAMKINVNTAPKEIIASFIDKDDALDIADKIVKERKDNPFKTFSEFLVFLSKLVPLLPENFFNLRPEMIFDVGSEIFSVKILCESHGVQSGLQVVLMRGTTEQSFETLFFRRF